MSNNIASGNNGGDDDSVNTTFEARMASISSNQQADPIHWDPNFAFRNQPYRHLYHQNGVIGIFQIRLLEGMNLQRSHWSPLALGPVKHLGLSKAHGAVSSFCSLWLQCKSISSIINSANNDNNNSNNSNNNNYSALYGDHRQNLDQKPVAKSINNKKNNDANNDSKNNVHSKVCTSPVIPQDNNPKWGANCVYQLPIHKGIVQNGDRILLNVKVQEDATAMESMIPGVPTGGTLGIGSVDITTLCFGQCEQTGHSHVGVLDVWIPITPVQSNNEMADQQQQKEQLETNALKKQSSTNNNNSTATSNPNNIPRIRVLISYTPVGMEPQCNDIIALEAFARPRRDTTCPNVLNPLKPLQVVKISGVWLLAKSSSSAAAANNNNNNNITTAGCIKLHRNCVFVIERKNILDETFNLAMVPADTFVSTPFGQSTITLLEPTFIASKQVLLPALLSAKLFWMALRTTTLAGLTGVSAATSAFVSEGTSSLTNPNGNNNNNNSHHNKNNNNNNNNNNPNIRRQSSTIVSL